MSAMYSSGIVDLIDNRWDGYDYSRDDVVAMVARIARPSSHGAAAEPTAAERQSAEALLAACD